uniref:Uncharacterized protein n=1 Tax=viral metagenome TaxID=1070528 RepID=A0A6C0C0P7_9ZZZZ
MNVPLCGYIASKYGHLAGRRGPFRTLISAEGTLWQLRCRSFAHETQGALSLFSFVS